MTKNVFVDGSYGTVGLSLKTLLQQHPNVNILEISHDKRKDASSRQRMIEQADLVVTCLPNSTVNNIVQQVPSGVKILDCSTQFRCDPKWMYGLPELSDTQRSKISDSNQVSNPGCSEAYNNISDALGAVYHGGAGGNINLQTRAEWSTTIE